MTYRANPFLKKLDSAAEATGMPALARHTRRHATLPFRVTPLLFLAWAVVGLVIQTRVPETGWLILMLAWTGGFPLLLTGPMRLPPGGMHDERERALIRSGHFSGLAAVALLAIGGCFLAGITSALSLLHYVAPLWTPHSVLDWIALGFFLLVVELNVAVLAISWKLPWRMPQDDDEN